MLWEKKGKLCLNLLFWPPKTKFMKIKKWEACSKLRLVKILEMGREGQSLPQKTFYLRLYLLLKTKSRFLNLSLNNTKWALPISTIFSISPAGGLKLFWNKIFFVSLRQKPRAPHLGLQCTKRLNFCIVRCVVRIGFRHLRMSVFFSRKLCAMRD